CHIRLMLLLPGVADPVRARHLIDRVVQPGVPFGGNLGPLRLALIDDPALLAAGPPAAPLQRLAATLAIIAVAKAVGPDQRAAATVSSSRQLVRRPSSSARPPRFKPPAAPAPGRHQRKRISYRHLLDPTGVAHRSGV